MMILTDLLSVLLSIGVVADVVFLWAYAWGNPWWTSNVGRALVSTHVGILAILAYGDVRRLAGITVTSTPPTTTLVLYTVVAAILVFQAYVFVLERRRVRHDKQQREDSR